MKRRPSQKTGRLAPYIEAIEEAKVTGYTWEDLRVVFEELGLDIATKPMQFRETFFRAKHRYEKGTLKADQLPLPDEDAAADSQNSQNSQNSEANQQEQQNQSETVGDRKGNWSQVDIEDYQSESKQESDSATDQNDQASEPEPESDPDDGPSLQERFAEKLKSRNNSNQ